MCECLNHPTRWLQPHARRFNYYEVDRSENRARAIELHRKMTSRSMLTKSPTCTRVAEICPRLACQVNLCDLPSLRISSGKDSYSFADSECASSVCQSLVEVDREYLCFHIVSMSFAPILNLVGLYGQGLKDQEKWLHETFPFQCFHWGGYAPLPSAALELQNQRPAPTSPTPCRQSAVYSNHRTKPGV